MSNLNTRLPTSSMANVKTGLAIRPIELEHQTVYLLGKSQKAMKSFFTIVFHSLYLSHNFCQQSSKVPSLIEPNSSVAQTLFL